VIGHGHLLCSFSAVEFGHGVSQAGDLGLTRRKAALDACKALTYIIDVIRSFRDKALERFFATGDGRRLSVQNTRRIANVLRALDDASRPDDMNLPGFRFHALVGRDRGRYAVNASGNWRITFGWSEGDAIEVDLEDYH
jgi:toxin HigB-1